jgi:hypothetical protein
LRYRDGEAVTIVEGKIQTVSDAEIVIAEKSRSVSIPLPQVEVGKLKLKW